MPWNGIRPCCERPRPRLTYSAWRPACRSGAPMDLTPSAPTTRPTGTRRRTSSRAHSPPLTPSGSGRDLDPRKNRGGCQRYPVGVPGRGSPGSQNTPLRAAVRREALPVRHTHQRWLDGCCCSCRRCPGVDGGHRSWRWDVAGGLRGLHGLRADRPMILTVHGGHGTRPTSRTLPRARRTPREDERASLEEFDAG